MAVYHRDSAVVKLNFSEERPAKPPRLHLAKNPTTDESLSVVCLMDKHFVVLYYSGQVQVVIVFWDVFPRLLPE